MTNDELANFISVTAAGLFGNSASTGFLDLDLDDIVGSAIASSALLDEQELDAPLYSSGKGIDELLSPLHGSISRWHRCQAAIEMKEDPPAQSRSIVVSE